MGSKWSKDAGVVNGNDKDAGVVDGNDKANKLKVVVIGETGSGKTSFLNLIANIEHISTLSDTETMRLEDVKHVHTLAQTENQARQGESQTNHAFAHKLPFMDFDLTLIDTPGFGDTRGLDFDERHVKSIQQAIEAQEFINCILLVMNGSAARMTAQLQWVLSQVTAILPREILDQIVVVFTNVTDPLDLNFDLDQLAPYLGRPLLADHVLMINNPYAKITKLLQAKNQQHQEESLRKIAAAFAEVYKEILIIFRKIGTFRPIGTIEFQKVYTARQKIELKSEKLQSEIQNQEVKRKELTLVKNELQESDAALSKLDKTVSAKAWKPTEGRHHMICRQCFKVCHQDCCIPFGGDKVDQFKDCQCFQWKVKKPLRITTDSERQKLLDHIVEQEVRVVENETGKFIRGERRINSDRNFTIGGIEVRGNPQKQWTTSQFSTNAHSDEQVSRTDLASKTLPFTFEMVDWSNVELGNGMECKDCGCALDAHFHQSSIPVWEQVPLIEQDAETRMQFTSLTSQKMTKETKLKQVEGELRKVEAQKRTLKCDLRKNLESFAEIAIAPSYMKFLNEQLSYMQLLLKNAKQDNNVTRITSLSDQIALLTELKKTINLADQ